MARVVRAQGRKGEVAAELWTDFPERLAGRKSLHVLAPDGSQRELEIEAVWPHKGRLVLKFRGVDSIGDAERLRGCELQVPLEERTPLPDGAAYVSDLMGCSVFDVDRNVPIGTIAEIRFGAGDAPLLVVRAADKEFLIPFAAEYVRTMDLKSRRLEVALPEGLLNLERPPSQEERESEQ
ncbi:MAG TPA: ribosome maturation factor RimM [Terriglobales bacterium]|nr:ribosome maturation factor RimM [Terriglobales bacterium]